MPVLHFPMGLIQILVPLMHFSFCRDISAAIAALAKASCVRHLCESHCTNHLKCTTLEFAQQSHELLSLIVKSHNFV